MLKRHLRVPFLMQLQWPLAECRQNPVFQLLLRIFKPVWVPENAVVLPDVEVKFVTFAAHEDHWQAESVCESSFVVNATAVTCEVSLVRFC